MGTRLIRERLRLARSLPAGVVVRRAAGLATRHIAAACARRRDAQQPSYCQDKLPGKLNAVCDSVSTARLELHHAWIERLAAQFAAHRFDLLGSGWVEVHHGMRCQGTDSVACLPGTTVEPDADGAWLAGRINESNLATSQAVWRLVDEGYRPIDWQIDFKSGYRWREDCWSADIPFGKEDGVDVKVPWELSRMQHLVILAFADALERAKTGATQTPFAYEFRNELLDFIATNPPRFGVNWRCTMDVAIRAANWVLAFGLLRANGATFDTAFETVLGRSLLDHGRHIAANLEFYPEGRSNHYLADAAGLAFIAATLPATPETDFWLAFAVQEIQGEMQFQFNPDGSNFEGSTCYHRLSLEMVTAATALIVGLPAARLDGALRAADPAFHTRPARPLTVPVSHPGPAHAARLVRGAEFTLHATKPDGRIVQIGDNDSGCFFAPHPVRPMTAGGAALDAEETLDHGGLVAAVAALTGDAALAEAGHDWLDAYFIRALTRGATLAPHCDMERNIAAHVRVHETALRHPATRGSHTTEIVVPGADLRRGLALYGYPDFGLWLFRSERLFLAVRCGPSVGAGSPGSHAHNDQLAIELAIDGEDWIADPGSYLYCPPLARRNAWRSVRAHAAPQWEGREPGRLDVGPFRLIDLAHAICLHFSQDGFAGIHRGFGAPVRRDVILGDDTISVHDTGLPPDSSRKCVRCVGRDETRRYFRAAVPFSPGYGRLVACGT